MPSVSKFYRRSEKARKDQGCFFLQQKHFTFSQLDCCTSVKIPLGVMCNNPEILFAPNFVE